MDAAAADAVSSVRIAADELRLVSSPRPVSSLAAVARPAPILVMRRVTPWSSALSAVWSHCWWLARSVRLRFHQFRREPLLPTIKKQSPQAQDL